MTISPPPPPPAPDRAGGLAWGIGLLALVPFPLVSALTAGIVMAVVGRSQRRQGPVAASNGRNAGNWGLTYALLTVVLWAIHTALLIAFTRDGPSSDFFPIGTAITAWAAVSVAHVVICIVGLVRTSRGGVLAVPAIRFLRG